MAVRRPSRSPTRLPATAGSRPSGRSSTSRSTVRAASSEPASASASSMSAGVNTTSHSGLIPRATASTGSKARARSSHATIAPPACASAATRRATVVLPEDASPRSATVAERGSPPAPRTASSAANPVETMRPSMPATATPGRVRVAGATGAGAVVTGVAVASSAGSSSGIGARARAPSTIPMSSLPRRGAAAPQRAWRAARVSETSDVRTIGRSIIERMFDPSRGFRRRVDGACRETAQPATPYPETASTTTPTPSNARPAHCIGRRRSPMRQTAYPIASTGPNELASPISHTGAISSPIA